MTINSLAEKMIEKDKLVNVHRLVTAYFTGKSDIPISGQCVPFSELIYDCIKAKATHEQT